MRIDNEFTVDAPIERVWDLFTDVEKLAPCMPGAQLTGVEDGVYSGKVKVKVGPVVAAYKGTARFVERDDEKHRAVVEASGRAERGAGNAAATVTVRLAEGEAAGRTAVAVETDLKITGKLAQLGGGMIKDVSERLLGQFVERAEEKLAALDTTEADGMTDDKDRNGEGTGSTSHMSGGAHMSGGGHMSGGAHMSGGDQMAGSGPLSDEKNESDGGGEPTTPTADPGLVPTEKAPETSETASMSGAAAVSTAPTKRTIDGPEAEPVDLMTVSGGGKLLWPALAVVAALAMGILIGYAVFG